MYIEEVDRYIEHIFTYSYIQREIVSSIKLS